MITIEDKTYVPTIDEIERYIDNKMFNTIDEYLLSEYHALRKIEYSGDKVLLGWNVKYKKGGRTLCTIYPRKGFFPLLVVIG